MRRETPLTPTLTAVLRTAFSTVGGLPSMDESRRERELLFGTVPFHFPSPPDGGRGQGEGGVEPC